ncbi:MAG: alpha/beta fold hydrolase [Geminicoccaceae bacterium]
MTAAHPPTVPLAVTELGDGPPLLFLHGLLGRARNWLTVGRAMADSHAVQLVDLRNHGASPWSDVAGYAAMAADIASLIESGGAGPPTLVGHSMGGKVAMTLALSRPELLRRLIIVDIAPVRYASGYERYIEAMLAADLSPGRRRTDVDAGLAAAVPDAAMRAFLMQNLESRDGRLAWQPNLAVLLTAMPELMDFPADLPAGAFAGPTRSLRGERSDYVGPAGEAALRRLFPDATVAAVPGAGHWPHAEQPAAFLAALREALSD